MGTNSNHVNLIICTPGHSLMSDYVKSLLATAQVLSQKGITWAWSNDYASHVADAREITLSGNRNNDITNTKPLEGKVTYDKILWIDSDMAWTPEDVTKVYESDKDVVSGAYMQSNGSVMAFDKLLGKSYMHNEVLEMKEPVRIATAGFGFICFKSGIFEKMSRPWFQMVPTSLEIDGKQYDFPIMGEDMSLCKRVTDMGFEIWLDPSVKLIHHKTMKVTWEGLLP